MGAAYRDRLTNLVEMFGITTLEFDLICAGLEGVAVPLQEVLHNFYSLQIPVNEIEEALAQLKKRNFPRCSAFFEQYAPLLPHERIRGTLLAIISQGEVATRLHRKKQQPYFFGMLLALLLAAMRKTALDLSETPLEEAVAMTALEISEIPCWEDLCTYFQRQDRVAVVRLLGDRLAQDCHGRHLAPMAATIGDEEYLPVLLRCFFRPDLSAVVREAVTAALIRYGEKATAHLRAHLSEVSDDLLRETLHVACGHRRNGCRGSRQREF